MFYSAVPPRYMDYYPGAGAGGYDAYAGGGGGYGYADDYYVNYGGGGGGYDDYYGYEDYDYHSQMPYGQSVPRGRGRGNYLVCILFIIVLVQSSTKSHRRSMQFTCPLVK